MSKKKGKTELEGAGQLDTIVKGQSRDRIETNPETGRKENWSHERRIADYYRRKHRYMKEGEEWN